MDLGATVCLPNGQPLCENCPWESVCQAHKMERECDFPVKQQKKARKIEEKAVLLIQDGDRIAIHKRPKNGLLADLWEFPNMDGLYTLEKMKETLYSWNLPDFEIEYLGEGKHIFSHVEWHMTGYHLEIGSMLVEEKQQLLQKNKWIIDSKEGLEEEYAIPSAFEYIKKRYKETK